jgi:hypothetical protein
MTFLAILLDSLSEGKSKYVKRHCWIHPVKKKLFIADNEAVAYAAFFNTILGYYKLADNTNDDNSLKSRLFTTALKPYINKYPDEIKLMEKEIEQKLYDLYKMETSPDGRNLDELSQGFADITGFILSGYSAGQNEELYKLGYNLGKWIYIIDAYDDLERDMKNNKFNALEAALNGNGLCCNEFKSRISDRIDFLLTACAAECMHCLSRLPLKKNEDLLYNILQFGLMEKMDKVFKRSCCNDEKPL